MHDLRQMIGQLLILGFDGCDLADAPELEQSLRQQHLGGVILFDKHLQQAGHPKNIVNTAQTQKLTAALQSVNQAEHPLLIAVDYEGGAVDRLSAACELTAPVSAAEQAKQTLPEFIAHAEQMASHLRELGFNVDFAPVVDVDITPDNPIIGQLGRSYSSDAVKVSELAETFVTTLQQQQVLTCYKHFPGHGSSHGDSHLGFVDVSTSWQAEELTPYRRLINAPVPVPMIMTAHVINRQLDASGVPATLSKPMLTDLLRDELHYEGVIISDDMQMKAISDHYHLFDACITAINAGVDMIIIGNQLSEAMITAEAFIEAIVAAIEQGKISLSRIHTAYQRVSALKAKLVS